MTNIKECIEMCEYAAKQCKEAGRYDEARAITAMTVAANKELEMFLETSKKEAPP